MSGTPYLAGSSSAGSSTSGVAPLGSTVVSPTKPQSVWQANMQNWSNLVSPIKWMKVYFGAGQYPTVPTAAVQAAQNLGYGVIFCYRPTFSGTTNDATWPGGADKPTAAQIAADQTSMVNSINALKTGLPRFAVTMIQEPQNSGGPNADQYTYLYYKNYATLHAICPVISDMAGHAPTQASTYFPGPTPANPTGTLYCDAYGVDYYGDAYHGGTFLSTWTVVADYASVPFGIFEMGNSNIASVMTQATVVSYLSATGIPGFPGDPTNSVQAVMQSRVNANKPNFACIWYANTQGTQGSGFQNDITQGNDYRIPLLQALQQTISTTGNQAAITTNTGPGDTLYVAAIATAGTVTGVSDTQNNQYTLIRSNTTESGAMLFVFACNNAAPLTGGTTPDIVTAQYSSSSSIQGVLVIGDNGVAPTGYDKLTDGAGVSTNMHAAATGTLSFNQEHVIAFFANAAAGGAPSFTSLTQIGQVEPASTAYLTAAYKLVTTNASQTPTGTIVSAQWSSVCVTDPAIPITVSLVLADGIVGENYSQTMEATGGSGTYTWATTGTLPPGVTMTGAGVFSGTATTAGTYTFTTTATDAYGATGSLTQVVIIIPGGSTSAALALPGNLLSPQDSDIESGGFTWAAETNATSVAASSNIALTGSRSLKWVSVADGLTQVSTGFYPVTPLLPYIASLYCMPSGPRDCYAGIEWYTSGGALISTTLGPDNPSPTNQWQSLTVAGSAPSTAAKCKLICQVAESNAGEHVHIDLAFLAQSHVQVLIDWVNAPYAPAATAGQDFMDVSPWVRLDTGITLTRGRQDAISEIQPGTCSFTLQNDSGIFTRKNMTSFITASLGGSLATQRRVQINEADELGAWHTRFDGVISEPQYSFDNTGNTSEAVINGTDILAYLSRENPLNCWTKETVLGNEPALHWTLNDTGNVGGSGVAAETSGNNGPPLRLAQPGHDNATIAWADTSGGVETLADAVAPLQPDGSEFWSTGNVQPSSQTRGLDSGTVGPYTTPLPSISLVPNLVAQGSQNQYAGNSGYQLQSRIPTIAPNAVGSDYAFEMWYTQDAGVKTNNALHYGPYIALSLGDSRTQTCIAAGIFLPGTFEAAYYSQPPAFLPANFSGVAPPTPIASTSKSITLDGARLPHHLVLNVQGDPSTPVVTVFLDNVQVGSFNLQKGQTFDTIVAGGAFGGLGAWWGNVSLLSVYNYQLSLQQIATDCQMGQYGMWESTTDDAITQLAAFANVPAFWSNLTAAHTGLSMTEYQDITGSNALTSMQLYEQAEMGLLFADAGGMANLRTRDWRMGHGAPDLLLPPNTFDAGMGYDLIDQFQINEQAVSTQVFQTGTSFTNDASQIQYGVYATNPIGSPLQLPLISWSRAYAKLGLPSYYYWADPNLSDLCAWQANSKADPWLVPGQLTIDLLTLDPATGLGISNFYALEIGSMVAPSGTLPASFPNANLSMEWFIEGINETISTTQRTIQFYCSPAETQRAWIPGDSTYGVLGTTARLGVSQADLSVPQADGKDVSHDGGPPYWTPNFAAGMNNPAANGHGFVGAADIRGLTRSIQSILQPPMGMAGLTGRTQTLSSGSGGNPNLISDTVYADTAAGMSLLENWPNWYVVTVPGFYEIDASLVAQTVATGGPGLQGWIVVAEGAAQAVAAGTATPLTCGLYVCPIGETQRLNSLSINTVCTPTTRIYLGLGDMVTVAAQQNTGGNLNLDVPFGGSRFSIRFAGYGTEDDRAEINSSLYTGGTVTDAPHSTSGTSTFANTHTYDYYGTTATHPYALRNTDGNVYQGAANGQFNTTGSCYAQIAFNVSALRTFFNGLTVTGCQLTCTDLYTNYSQGTLMIGYYVATSGTPTWIPANQANQRNMAQESFSRGQAKTFTIPVAIAQALLTGSANGLMIGDNSTSKLQYYGYWKGGPGTWQLSFDWHS